MCKYILIYLTFHIRLVLLYCDITTKQESNCIWFDLQRPRLCRAMRSGHRWGGPGRYCAANSLHAHSGVLLRQRHQHPARVWSEAPRAGARRAGHRWQQRAQRLPLHPSHCKYTSIRTLLSVGKLFRILISYDVDLRCILFFFSPQNSQCQPLKCQALKDVGNYCEESRCKNQWIPYLSLQERWTSRDAIAARKGWKSHSLWMKAKGLCTSRRWLLFCVTWRGCEREKAELLELCARYMIPPCPSSLSCPPWEKEKVVALVAEEQGVGKATSCAGELARRRRGLARARPRFHNVQWVGKRWVYVTIADCGTNILKCWVNHLCISRARLTMNCSSIYVKLHMDCNRFC